MGNSFDNVISQKTNEELIKIVTVDIDKYQENAIESAKKEIELRNIDIQKFQEVSQKLISEKEITETFKLNHARTSVRLLNFIIDFVSFVIIFRIIGGFFMLISDINIDKNPTPFVFFMIFAFILNYGIMEYKFQKTLGKFITKTKVVNIEGEKPSVNDIISRTFCRLLPFDRLSFLFTKYGFHDSISNTRVIKDI